MKYEKGKSGNPEGRPPGSKSKSSEEIRTILLKFLDCNLDGLQGMFDDLDAKDKVRLISVILRYTVAPPFNPEALTEDQLLQIINHLKNEQDQKSLIARN